MHLAIQTAPEPRNCPVAYPDDLDFAVECWAQRVIALSILFAEGRLDLIPAVDRAWEAAERAGLVDAFGPDEIQAAMSLAFGAVRC